MRLDKFLCNALQITRSVAHNEIRNGRVVVNKKVIRKKDFHIKEEIDIIEYDGQVIDYREFVYFMMNKPAGVVSAVIDNVDKTVVDLIKERKDIFPVGRLDKDVEGLLILTNNGKLAHHLTSPKQKVYKKYLVETAKPMREEDIELFNKGFEIKDGNNVLYKTKPSILEIIDEFSCFISLYEGKFHQVKRMFIANNNEVVYLKRVAMGSIELDKNLGLGEYRYLNDDEIKIIKEIGNFKV